MKPTPTLEPQLLKGLHVAFEDFARALAVKLTAFVEQRARGRHNAKTLEKDIAHLVPTLLEQEFIERFLEDKKAAHRRRALLLHLLSVAELQSFTEMQIEVYLAPLPSSLSSANDDDDDEDEEITSEAAAKLLHVSRTHVNTLEESGQLGEVRLTPGGHRRLSRAAVLRYKDASKKRQAKALDSMMETTTRMGLYDSELAAIPARPKR